MIGGFVVFGPLIGAAMHVFGDPSDRRTLRGAPEAGVESVERAVERQVRPFPMLGWIAEHFHGLAAIIVLAVAAFFGRR